MYPDPSRSNVARVGLRLRQWLNLALGVLLVFLLGPLSILAFGELTSWHTGSRGSSGQAPDPALVAEPVVHVYGARTVGWRGAFGMHSWIATKRRNASTYVVHQVIGWRYYRGDSPVVSRPGIPDSYWFGARPDLLTERRGDDVEALIDRIEAAVQTYPYQNLYRVWPGPNSNTFTADIARQLPELALDLPSNALGKDYLGNWRLIAPTPSGTGWQFSLGGLFGVGLALEEGIEINFFGLAAGIDFNDWALRLPGLGRVSIFNASP